MPDEFSRTTVRKTVKLPSGEKIRIPVISKIAFIDPYERYQETEHSLDNTEQSTRIAHVDDVHPVVVDRDGIPTADPPSVDESKDLFCERIDTWHAIDQFDRYQETHLTLDNVTGNDKLPPNFSNHEKTHIYRYHKDPNNPDDENGAWIDSELIDEFSVIDPYERYQEKHYTLQNPTNEEFRGGDLSGQASADDPDITIGGEFEGLVDNPIRVDPFQNIVNYQSLRSITVRFQFSLNITTLSSGPSTVCFTPIPIPPTAVVVGPYDTVLAFVGPGAPLISPATEGAVVTGAPTITPSTTTLGNYLNSDSWPALADNQNTDGTADYHVKAAAILGNAPGCYGSGATGSTGIGYLPQPPSIVEVMTGTIDASGVSLKVNGVPWVVNIIGISGGSPTYDPSATYQVAIDFQPP